MLVAPVTTIRFIRYTSSSTSGIHIFFFSSSPIQKRIHILKRRREHTAVGKPPGRCLRLCILLLRDKHLTDNRALLPENFCEILSQAPAAFQASVRKSIRRGKLLQVLGNSNPALLAHTDQRLTEEAHLGLADRMVPSLLITNNLIGNLLCRIVCSSCRFICRLPRRSRRPPHRRMPAPRRSRRAGSIPWTPYWDS